MERRTNVGMRTIQCLSGIFLAVAILYFVIGELSSEKEVYFKVGGSVPFNDDWEMVTPEGLRVPITVPGANDVKSGDVLRIEKKLPNDMDNVWLCIRSTQQDITISVDGQVRKFYSTKGTRNFGKNSVSVYVFAELYAEDAGKILSIDIVSYSPYSGYVNNMVIGDREQIWTGLVKKYLPVTILAMFMLVLSVMLVFYCVIVHVIYKKNMDIAYLGLALLVASVWIIAESKLRQIFLPNSTIASDVGFFMIMLLPFPFVSYINKIQKNRYEKGYMLVCFCAVINFVISTLLQFADIKDFSETMTVSHVIIVAFIVMLFVNVIIDIKKKHILEYKEVALGFAGLMLAGIVEIYQVYDEAAVNNGIALCIGLVFLFFMAVIQTGRDLLQLEKDKQIAVAASESRTMFLANMSHEIRTPINTIVGMNEMILRENQNNDTKEYAKNIDNASKLLMGLIDDILDFSKLDAGKLEICENPYTVAAMLKDVFLGASVRMEDKELEVKIDVDEKLPSVLRGDEIRIKQIFNNLLSNAIKYTVEGSISISMKGSFNKDNYYLVFKVADTGVGIREEDLPTIFDSFRRMELKRNKYIQGTGLGLSITKQLVENMQGTIEVESTYGKGSCFTVTIPQEIVDSTPMGDIKDAFFAVETGEEEKEIMRFSSERSVLIVDDNDMNLKVMKALLGKSGLSLDFASSGTECIDKCKRKKYDLIFMDHMMPYPDGIETLHLIKEDNDGMNKDTIVVVLTANAIKGASDQYEKEGFADYVTKPVEYIKLEEVLVKYLGDSTIEGKSGASAWLKDEPFDAEKQIKVDVLTPEVKGMDITPSYKLDREEGLKYCGGLDDLYQEVLEHYVKNATNYKEELAKCYEDKNWQEYARISHTLKSNSLTIGLKDFSELAKQHEYAAKSGDEDFVNNHYEYFIKCLIESIKVVGKEIG
ncbi:MAG: response regulator [Lachnospiraceae bacterium]|nr:response regulator [Lachnospiraceae bacterium]